MASVTSSTSRSARTLNPSAEGDPRAAGRHCSRSARPSRGRCHRATGRAARAPIRPVRRHGRRRWLESSPRNERTAARQACGGSRVRHRTVRRGLAPAERPPDRAGPHRRPSSVTRGRPPPCHRRRAGSRHCCSRSRHPARCPRSTTTRSTTPSSGPGSSPTGSATARWRCC